MEVRTVNALKGLAAGALIAAAGVAAFQLGLRVNDETAMVFLGIMCGIVASIPVSVFLLWTLTRDRNAMPYGAPIHEDAQEIITPSTAEYWTVSTPDTPQLPAPQTARYLRK